jgi:hypothetical protein
VTRMSDTSSGGFCCDRPSRSLATRTVRTHPTARREAGPPG